MQHQHWCGILDTRMKIFETHIKLFGIMVQEL